MIFLTIGTHEPFDRLIRAVDDWCGRMPGGHVLFGQITDPKPDSYLPQHFEWVSRLTPAEYSDRVARSSLIVSHAGMGSIITALHSGKPIVVMPRRGHLRETRNDHQFTTVRMLGGRAGIYVADDEDSLGAVLDEAISELGNTSAPRIAPFADAAFTDALGAFLSGQKNNKTSSK
jgi:UDP-N-acetylglucosamine transferase subunit ALG13